MHFVAAGAHQGPAGIVPMVHTAEKSQSGVWALQFGGLFEIISALCEEVLELAVFGPYDKPSSPPHDGVLTSPSHGGTDT
ncbi:hypothetical protein LTR65_001804 [Meristemomyces frigidus]